MSKMINQRELRNASAEVLREVQAGQAVIVCRYGEPIAELRPIPPRRFVPRHVLAKAVAGAECIDPDRFRADLDAIVDSSVDA